MSKKRMSVLDMEIVLHLREVRKSMRISGPEWGKLCDLSAMNTITHREGGRGSYKASELFLLSKRLNLPMERLLPETSKCL